MSPLKFLAHGSRPLTLAVSGQWVSLNLEIGAKGHFQQEPEKTITSYTVNASNDCKDSKNQLGPRREFIYGSGDQSHKSAIFPENKSARQFFVVGPRF
jgi:hypothetical protein